MSLTNNSVPNLTTIDIHSLKEGGADMLFYCDVANLTVLRINGRRNPKHYPHQQLLMLELGNNFIGSIMDNAAPQLTELSIGASFTGLVDDFLCTLVKLSIDDAHKATGMFNIPIDNLLPQLLYLLVAGVFNSCMDNLPANLRELDLRRLEFNANMDHLPPSLEHLSLGLSFLRQAAHLPSSLIGLTIPHSSYLDQYATFDFLACMKLQSLQLFQGHAGGFSTCVDLPSSLLELRIIGGGFARFNIATQSALRKVSILTVCALGAVEMQAICQFVELPQLIAVTRLEMPRCFEGVIDHLSSTLTLLTLRASFNEHIDYLPDSLFHLKICTSRNNRSVFNRPVDNFPNTLLSFAFKGHSSFDHSLDHLPEHLTDLIFYSAPCVNFSPTTATTAGAYQAPG